MYSLEFRAWIGHQDEVDYEGPVEFFDKNFNTIDEAKSVFTNDCFRWKEGEWQDYYITISFKNEPKIFDDEGKLKSKCIITDYDDYDFEWIDE